MKVNSMGCCLLDSLYNDFNYEDSKFKKLVTKKPGDGGLILGGLTFIEDLLKFSGMTQEELDDYLLKGHTKVSENIGGPCIVCMIDATQVCHNNPVEFSYYGTLGKDKRAESILSLLKNVNIKADFSFNENYSSPESIVLSDVNANNGKGERTFANRIGAADIIRDEVIPDSIYDCDVLVLGGTALNPHLHKDLSKVLRKAKKNNVFTLVGTVYDFKNQKEHPDQPWPLGDGEQDYSTIDTLVCDKEEALRISGKVDIIDAVHELKNRGVHALIITNGSKDTLVWSKGDVFAPLGLTSFPVCGYIDELIEKDPTLFKDTTGCGDNFLGGVLTSICLQKLDNKPGELLDIRDACIWGTVTGGYGVFSYGGVFHEKFKGEKRQALEIIKKHYIEQLQNDNK